jgi:hypothetical protein
MSPALLFALALLASPASGDERSVGRVWREPEGELCFDLPDGLVDWSALAREALGPALDHPESEMLRRHPFESGGSSHVRFEAPVPPQVAARGWQLVHEDGVTAVQPGRLRGEVSYDVDRELRWLGSMTISGSACASIPLAKPAFVLGGPVEEWTAEPVPWTPETAGVSFETAGERYRVEAPDFAVPRAGKVLVLRSKARQLSWALVSWAPDPRCEQACCEHAFSLVELGPGGKLRGVFENGYGCDV